MRPLVDTNCNPIREIDTILEATTSSESPKKPNKINPRKLRTPPMENFIVSNS